VRILKGLPEKPGAGHGLSDEEGSFDSLPMATAYHIYVRVKLPVNYSDGLAIVLLLGFVHRAQVHYRISHAKLSLNLSRDLNRLR
jgi:hypothetical protein